MHYTFWINIAKFINHLMSMDFSSITGDNQSIRIDSFLKGCHRNVRQAVSKGFIVYISLDSGPRPRHDGCRLRSIINFEWFADRRIFRAALHRLACCKCAVVFLQSLNSFFTKYSHVFGKKCRCNLQFDVKYVKKQNVLQLPCAHHLIADRLHSSFFVCFFSLLAFLH